MSEPTVRAELAKALRESVRIPFAAPQPSEAVLRLEAEWEPIAENILRWHAYALECSTGAVRVVLDLHGPHRVHLHYWYPSRGFECAGCEFEGYEAEPPEWPCQTYRAVVPWIEYEEAE